VIREGGRDGVHERVEVVKLPAVNWRYLQGRPAMEAAGQTNQPMGVGRDWLVDRCAIGFGCSLEQSFSQEPDGLAAALDIAGLQGGTILTNHSEYSLRPGRPDVIERLEARHRVIIFHRGEITGEFEEAAMRSPPPAAIGFDHARVNPPPTLGGLDHVVELDTDSPDVIHDLPTRPAIQLQDRQITNMDVIAATAGKDDLQVLEGEIVQEERKQAMQRGFTSGQHLAVRVSLGIDRWEVVRIQVEDQVRALPVLLSHGRRPGITVSPCGEVDVLRSLASEERIQLPEFEQRSVPDH
jgi:hypothetical protein